VTQKRRSLLALLLAATWSRSASTADGPYCWAGVNDAGNDKFIPCKPTHEERWLTLDMSGLEGIKINSGNEVFSIPKDQVLLALSEERHLPKSVDER